MSSIIAGNGSASQAQAQTDESSQFLRSYAETRGFMLGRPSKAKASPDGKSVLFLRAEPRAAKQSLFAFDTVSKETRELLTPAQVLKGADEHLSEEEKARRERQRISVGGFTDFQLSDDSALIMVSLSGKLYIVERDSGKIKHLDTGVGDVLDPKFSPDSKYVSYVKNEDIHLIELETSKSKQLTFGGSKSISHGLAEFVAQEEMSRFTGYWWSGDSKHIAFEIADNSPVEIWHISDPEHPEKTPTAAFYPSVGKANAKTKLAVISLGADKPVYLDWQSDAKFEYLANVSWAKDSPLTLVVLSRDQKDLEVLEADFKSGKCKVLFSEHDDDWINLYKNMPCWLTGGKSFIWITERNGFPQLEERSQTGAFIRSLSKQEDGLRDFSHVDAEGGFLYFAGSSDPRQIQIKKLDLKSGKRSTLSKSAGIFEASFSKSHKIYTESASFENEMPGVSVMEADGTRLGSLPSVSEEPPFSPNREYLELDLESKLYAVIIRPRSFDKTKRYPVILDVYGGPHSLKVLKSKRSYLLDQWLADQGFIIVSIDNRGTPGRGRSFERAIAKKFGSLPLEDQVQGLEAICKKYKELDKDRIGVTGWSFGGYMSALAVLRRPDIFKAAVAGAPVVDWLDYDTCYTERYLGLLEKEADAYKEASLLTYAPELIRPLLLVHGTTDDNVYFKHSLKLADALFKSGKEFGILPLSGLTHMVPDPVVMENLWKRIVGHFKTHLGKPE